MRDGRGVAGTRSRGLRTSPARQLRADTARLVVHDPVNRSSHSVNYTSHSRAIPPLITLSWHHWIASTGSSKSPLPPTNRRPRSLRSGGGLPPRLFHASRWPSPAACRTNSMAFARSGRSPPLPLWYIPARLKSPLRSPRQPRPRTTGPRPRDPDQPRGRTGTRGPHSTGQRHLPTRRSAIVPRPSPVNLPDRGRGPRLGGRCRGSRGPGRLHRHRRWGPRFRPPRTVFAADTWPAVRRTRPPPHTPTP